MLDLASKRSCLGELHECGGDNVVVVVVRERRGGNLVIGLPFRKRRFWFSLSPTQFSFARSAPPQFVSSVLFCKGRIRIYFGLRFRIFEPVSGIEPDPPVYESGALPIELRGQVPAVRARGSSWRVQRKIGFGEEGAAGAGRHTIVFVRVKRPGLFRLVPKTSALPLGYRPDAPCGESSVGELGGSVGVEPTILCVYDLVEWTNVAPTEGIEPSRTRSGRPSFQRRAEMYPFARVKKPFLISR